MKITNFRDVNQEPGVVTAYVDVGRWWNKRSFAIVKKDGCSWLFLHNWAKLPEHAQVYCDEQMGEG